MADVEDLAELQAAADSGYTSVAAYRAALAERRAHDLAAGCAGQIALDLPGQGSMDDLEDADA